jgi:hypothetical protein
MTRSVGPGGLQPDGHERGYDAEVPQGLPPGGATAPRAGTGRFSLCAPLAVAGDST